MRGRRPGDADRGRGQWARNGVPEHPLGWLTTVAARRYVDQVRSDAARERREQAVFELLFLCCHPALTPPAQMALTLRAVAGLTTAEIAAAFLVPDKTIGQRISRAKQRLRDAGARFELPPESEAGLVWTWCCTC